MLDVFKEQQEERVSMFLWQEVATEHQYRGRKDPVVRSLMEHSRSCSIRNSPWRFLSRDVPRAVVGRIMCGLLPSFLVLSICVASPTLVAARQV